VIRDQKNAKDQDGFSRLQEFIVNLKWRDLPPQVQHQAKRCLLDAMGALIAGMETPVGTLMTAFAVEQFKGDEARILVSGKRSSAVGAALANGFAGNALDIDDGYRLVKGHPGACILPVLLAASELASACSGEDFLTAFVMGYEVGIRAGLIRHATYQTYHASGSWGAIGGAAAAGKVLGLDWESIRQAMGAAEYHAPIAPMMKGIATPSMVKDGIGWGAMVSMASILMARSGFTGIEPLFGDTPNQDWIAGLGVQYEILNLYFKPYAACRWAQPAVAGALKLVGENRLSMEEVASIHVRTFAAAAELSRAHPRDTEEAQYNLSFPVAAALVDGEVGPRQVLPPRLGDRSLLALADRISVEVEEDYEKAFPAKARAEVVIRTVDGRVFSSGTVEARWEPPDTLPADEELQDKFLRLAEPVLGGQRSQELVARIWKFDRAHDAPLLADLSIRQGTA
jgi:2-methylcitrate dehydratase PrpD